MSKNKYFILLIVFFIIAQIGVWMGMNAIDKISNETGFLKCIPDITSESLCRELMIFKIIFWIGVIPFIGMLIFKKRILNK